MNISSIDYDWKKPQTYLVLVPCLSLIIQKIQMAEVLPFEEIGLNTQPEKFEENNKKQKKFEAICKWHLRGTLVQMIAFHVAKYFALNVHPLIPLMAMYECGTTLYRAWTNRCAVYELGTRTDGSHYIKKMTFFSPVNIF